MNFSRRARLVAASIGTGALLMATTATIAVTAASAAPTSAAIPACGSSAMEVWTGSPADDDLGHSFWQVEISNVGHHACTLQGFPGVSVRSRGHQVGLPADRNTSSKPLVSIPAGGTAHFVLEVTDPFNACRHPVHGSDLRVFAPNQFHAETTPFSVSVCPHKVTLHVDAVHAGTGIPGHTTS